MNFELYSTKNTDMKKLIIVVFAVVSFTSCSQDQEPQPLDLTNSTMFGVKGNSHDSADLHQFTVLNSTRSVYVKFKSDAEAYYGIYMNNANVNPWGVTYYSTFKNNDPNLYYQIAWDDSNNSFSFSWSK